MLHPFLMFLYQQEAVLYRGAYLDRHRAAIDGPVALKGAVSGHQGRVVLQQDRATICTTTTHKHPGLVSSREDPKLPGSPTQKGCT